LTKLRISIVQYLNTAPLVWGFTNGPLQGKYHLSFTVPSQCAVALRSGAADVAIIPAIEYQRIPRLTILPDLAIASKERVRSLLIMSKTPISEARRIALDRSSRSTQALVRILCADKWKITPEFFEAEPTLEKMLDEADAALLIGDPALRLSVAIEKGSRRASSGELVCHGSAASIPHADTVYVYDVVEAWRGLTGLPAVLAVWAARNEVVTREVVQDFLSSRAYGISRIAEISRAASLELDLPADVLESYLTRNIDFSLSQQNRQGLHEYYKRAAALGLIPAAREIEWVANAAMENARAQA
jgi:chorismate dehydratase